jgi:hypothetical protein
MKRAPSRRSNRLMGAGPDGTTAADLGDLQANIKGTSKVVPHLIH